MTFRCSLRCAGDAEARTSGEFEVVEYLADAGNGGLEVLRLKRYRCKQCRVTFNALTQTPLARLHNLELWSGHAQALVEGISLRKVAARLDVHLETAFHWRHRFLMAPKDLKPKALTGTVEADETYFLYSQKGARDLTRPARKRGVARPRSVVCHEQVPVLIARDRHDATTDQILDDRSTQSIAAVLGPVVAKTAVLVSDGAQAYRPSPIRPASRTWG